MPKYELGQRVRYVAVMERGDSRQQHNWSRYPRHGEGIIVGKRTCTDGHKRYDSLTGDRYHVTKQYFFWLVAHNLSGYRHVAEADIEAVEVAKSDGIDGYEWEETDGHPEQG